MKYEHKRKEFGGFILIETLQGIVLSVLMLTAIFQCFAVFMQAHNRMISDMVFMQHVRYAMSSLINDAAYAYAIEEKNKKMTILYRENFQWEKKIVYEVVRSKLYKDSQPVTGDDKNAQIAIEDLVVYRYDDHVVFIKLKARNQQTGREIVLETGVFLENR